ncbi:MAG: hypothetical protein ACP5MM_02060 [Acidithiobacillus sp.]|uniref:hypothetical protein n=1 Tax=Acidithiobacillus sp. TaxID=1872118 RepID=UPI003CFFE6A8
MTERTALEAFRRWRETGAAGQGVILADPAQRREVCEGFQAFFLPYWWGEAAAPMSLHGVLDLWALFAALGEIPGDHFGAFLAAQEKELSPPGHALPDALQCAAAEPLPMDMELDLLAAAMEERDLAKAAPLVFSMVEDEGARRALLERLGQRLADDNYEQGLRTLLFAQWRDAAAGLAPRSLGAGALALLHCHWRLPAGLTVVVPEARAGHDGRVFDKPLLHALRERDLPAFMGRIRAMGDQPLDAVRQLLLSVTLLILERGGGEDREALARLYVWLVTLLTMPQRSLRRTRRILFSAAATTFAFAGWKATGDWPDYAALAAYHSQAGAGAAAASALSWQGVLDAHAAGAGPDWAVRFAEIVALPAAPQGFWPLWRAVNRAGAVTGGPLSWIHPLVLLRLYAP